VTPPATPHSVIFLGFTAFERNALAAYNRLSANDEQLPFLIVERIEQADFAIVDGDDGDAVEQVVAAGRHQDAVYVGAQAPDGALGWMMRPMDPLHVFGELHAAAALRQRRADTPQAPAAALEPKPPPAPVPLEHSVTITEPGQRQRSGDAKPAVLALLVDDSDIALRFMQRLLHGIGVRTESATYSDRALELARNIGPDLVFLDVELGPSSELDGFELCQRFKQMVNAKGQPMKVVMLTAHDAPSDRVKGTFVGCDAYLAKPADEDTVRRTLRDLGLMERGLLPKRRQRGDFSTSRTGVAED
jgi:CheY-like chemotaxis protein